MKACKTAENAMNKCEKQLKEIEVKMAESDLYEEQNKAQLKQILADKISIEKSLADQEIRWMEATEAYEKAVK